MVTVAVGDPVVRIMVAEATETQERVAMETQERAALETLIITRAGRMGEIDCSRHVLPTILAGVVVFFTICMMHPLFDK